MNLLPLPSTGITAVLAALPLQLDQPTLWQIGFVLSWLLAVTNSFRPRVSFRRAWRVAATLLTIGLSLLVTFCSLGSTIDEQGFLHEPFPLLAIGSLLSFTGLVLAFLLALATGARKIAAHCANCR